MTPSSPWLGRFFETYYRRRPVNATFIGVHDYDRELPDFSENGAGDTLAEMRSQLQTLDGASVDHRLAAGYLRTQISEFQSGHFHRGNPSLYTGEAVFGVMSLLLTDFAPVADRIDAAAARLAGIPRLLDQGRTNVREAPIGWTERAIKECTGLTAFLTDGISRLPPPATDVLAGPAVLALAAVAEFRHYLVSELRQRPRINCAAGPEALELNLREGHCLTTSANELAAYAESELELAQDALARVAPPPSEPAGTRARYQELWHEVRHLADVHELLTWPDFPIRFVDRPAWAKAAAPDLYFLYYRAPAAFNRPAVHEYLVPPELPSENAIKLNHVVHHGGIGHHVQNWHAARAPSAIGRIAAVDCASRIAMLCGGTMAEGWACYATDLMGEIGFLTPAEQRDELATRCRICARAVVDVRLHQGRFTLAEAAEYYQREAGMPAGAAMGEAVKNSMFPGGAVMYLTGRDEIHGLRRALSARLGSAFSLRAFHDQFLAYGSIPVTLIATDMIQRADAAE